MTTDINYTYDNLGQLIKVEDPFDTTAGSSGTLWEYKYDRGGNILKKTYSELGEPNAAKTVIPYEYRDSRWKDMLTKYNGYEITYDLIGNPLNDGEREYTWAAGRQLQKIEMGSKTITFKYDHNGLRTQKKVKEGDTTTTYDYYLHGELITHMTKSVAVGNSTTSTQAAHFFYDTQSRPALKRINNDGNVTYYRYVHNLQGDVIAILDTEGNSVVEYKYDAWGTPTSITGTQKDSLGKLNPFRYRGYVWDEENEVYYLNKRYYAPPPQQVY